MAAVANEVKLSEDMWHGGFDQPLEIPPIGGGGRGGIGPQNDIPLRLLLFRLLAEGAQAYIVEVADRNREPL